MTARETGAVERDALERARLDLNHLAEKYGEQEFVAPTLCKLAAAVAAHDAEELGDCELCNEPLAVGQFVNVYDDIGTAHANCEKPFAKPAEETPAPADDGSTMPTYVLLGEPALLETVEVSRPQPTPATGEVVERAAAETARLRRELDITNADHIALWIEANTIPDEPMNQCASWLACRIVEAHEHRAEQQAATIAELRSALGLILNGPLGSQAFRRFALCIARSTLERTRGQ